MAHVVECNGVTFVTADREKVAEAIVEELAARVALQNSTIRNVRGTIEILGPAANLNAIQETISRRARECHCGYSVSRASHDPESGKWVTQKTNYISYTLQALTRAFL